MNVSKPEANEMTTITAQALISIEQTFNFVAKCKCSVEPIKVCSDFVWAEVHIPSAHMGNFHAFTETAAHICKDADFRFHRYFHNRSTVCIQIFG